MTEDSTPRCINWAQWALEHPGEEIPQPITGEALYQAMREGKVFVIENGKKVEPPPLDPA
jgi:hypothetical protein